MQALLELKQKDHHPLQQVFYFNCFFIIESTEANYFNWALVFIIRLKITIFIKFKEVVINKVILIAMAVMRNFLIFLLIILFVVTLSILFHISKDTFLQQWKLCLRFKFAMWEDLNDFH